MQSCISICYSKLNILYRIHVFFLKRDYSRVWGLTFVRIYSVDTNVNEDQMFVRLSV